LDLPGSAAALPIFAEFMRGLVGVNGRGDFLPPAGLERISIDPQTGLRSGPSCAGDPELFLEGTAPELRCDGKPPGAVDRLFDWFRDRM
jgi:membrane carboxypeptidase/penicillin-binding protein